MNDTDALMLALRKLAAEEPLGVNTVRLAVEKIIDLEEENAQLREALLQEREENLWNAYNTGHERDGEWTHCFMSDGEWLAHECGFDPAKGYYTAADIKAAIPKAARAALADTGGSDESA